MLFYVKHFIFLILFFIVTLSLDLSAAVRCPLDSNQINLRIQFADTYKKSLEPGRAVFERYYQENLADLKAMEKAHLASDIFAGISAAASLYVGSVVMAGALTSGTITFLGTSYSTTSLIGGSYMGYQGLSLSKASYDFTNFTASFFSESPRDIFASQVTTLRTQGLITSKVHGFITDPDWSGYSTDLEHPSFEVAINKLDEFRDAQLAEIGNSRSTWGYLGEFWHERGLKTSALETAVFNEARNIQEQRIIYLDIVINLLKHQKEICQR